MGYLTNISNHPSNKWSTEQIEKAKELGKGNVLDIQFPVVDPNLNREAVFSLASKIADKVFGKTISSDDSQHYVHIMGESGFVYAFIAYIYQMTSSINCIHSTTERIVEEKDGQKVSTFKFVQFREY